MCFGYSSFLQLLLKKNSKETLNTKVKGEEKNFADIFFNKYNNKAENKIFAINFTKHFIARTYQSKKCNNTQQNKKKLNNNWIACHFWTQSYRLQNQSKFVNKTNTVHANFCVDNDTLCVKKAYHSSEKHTNLFKIKQIKDRSNDERGNERHVLVSYFMTCPCGIVHRENEKYNF